MFLSKRRGLSQLEIIMVVAISAIVLAVAVPITRRSLDRQSVTATGARLVSFIADARSTARTIGTVLLTPVGGTTFSHCLGLRTDVVGTTSATHIFAPESGVVITGGPDVSGLTILPSGDFDANGSGYLGVQGGFSENAAFVTFNAAGTATMTEKAPSDQLSSTNLGESTVALLGGLGLSTGSTGTSSGTSAGSTGTSSGTSGGSAGTLAPAASGSYLEAGAGAGGGSVAPIAAPTALPGRSAGSFLHAPDLAVLRSSLQSTISAASVTQAVQQVGGP
ncbi:MAG: hypothetical protein EB084_13210 [Proteobacteria bacterium]|nr:hypothetical protein [Pseudomonadota bacterium]